MTRVAVVGGGIAGLALAEALRRRRPSLEVVVLEKSDRVGGNIRTDAIDGFTCERGPDGFLDSVPETLELVARAGLHNRLQVSDDAARKRYVFRNGRLHPVPMSAMGFVRSRLLSWPGKLRILGEPFAARRPEGPAGDSESIHAFAARRIGREAADVLIDSMVSGIFAGDARTLSLRACFPKMWQMETDHGGLVRAMIAKRRTRRRDSAPGAPAGRLTSFKGGMEELVRGVAAHLGRIVRTSARVSGLDAHVGGYTLRIHGQGTVEADAVALTGGAADAASILDPYSPGLSRELRSIAGAPLAVVCLGYDAAALARAGVSLDGFGFLVPHGQGPRILGALWESSIYPGRAPEGKALIRAMIGGALDPGVVDLDDEALVSAVRGDLATTMGIRIEPGFEQIYRHRAGIPQYTIGHLPRLERIERHLDRLPGIYLAGNAYRGVAINSCIAEAGPLAERILEDLDRRPAGVDPPTVLASALA